MLPHLLQHWSTAFQLVLHPAHPVPAHLTVGSLLQKDAVSETVKAFTEQKVSYDCMYPLINISSMSLVLTSFKTDWQFANQESYSWLSYCFSVLTASCSGGKLFFLSNLCSCWFIQSLLYLDSWACSVGWLSYKEEGTSLFCLRLPCVCTEKTLLPCGSLQHGLRQKMMTGYRARPSKERWQRAYWNSDFLCRFGESWRVRRPIKVFPSQYEPKWD